MDGGKSCVLLVSIAMQSALLAPLAAHGLAVTRVNDVESAMSALSSQLFDLALVELEGSLGVEVVRSLAEKYPDVPLVAAGPETDELVRTALAAGACELLSLPLAVGALDLALSSALSRCQVAPLESPHVSSQVGLLGGSPLLVAVRERTQRVASGSATVLVRGETGTGKELVARAIHAQSQRQSGPFVRVHVSALPDALLESELFGYEKGAFTGATARKPGRVELAEGGTLFFDEIGEISMAMQVKLLRLIQEREYERLGGTRTLQADVRFVAATHRDVEHMVEVGTFREDLFYRLNVVTVWLPPLRSRRDDIPLIAQHYLRVFREKNGKPELDFDDAALGLLTAQRWPGNVRQLVNFVERLVVLAESPSIGADEVRRHFEEQMAFLTQAAASSQDGRVESAPPPVIATEPEPVVPASKPEDAPADELSFSSAVRPLREDMRRAERRALLKALHYASGNRALAARMLGVSRRTLYTKLDEHALD